MIELQTAITYYDSNGATRDGYYVGKVNKGKKKGYYKIKRYDGKVLEVAPGKIRNNL